MAEEVKKEKEEQEVTPTWATKLQESLDRMNESLSEMFPPSPLESDPNEPQEIPVPQPPQQEEIPTPMEVPVEQETPQPKKRKFLDWLM